jgi:hypothetical protein
VLNNGDRITGEVKELAYGQLKYSTDDIGTLYIEWGKIVTIQSTQAFQVDMLDGRVLYGRLAPEQGLPGTVTLRGNTRAGGAEEEFLLELQSIARINVLDEGSWRDRFDGSFSLGYSFAKSTGVEVFNLSATIQSRNQRRFWSVDLDSQLSDQDEGAASTRWSLVGTVSRPMKVNSFYREGTLQFTRNDELGLQLRGLLGGSIGRYLHVTPESEWRASLGLAASRERGTDETTRNNLEGQVGMSYRLFRLDTPKASVTASATVLPSITESGRVRGEASLNLRREIVKDLFVELQVYDSYDNRPADGASTNDWGVTTSVGYSF